MATATRATVLIVEDDPGIAELEKSRLEEAGYEAVVTSTAEDALRALGGGSVDLILLDYRLPGGVDGLEFYARVKGAGYDVPVILVTGFSSEVGGARADARPERVVRPGRARRPGGARPPGGAAQRTGGAGRGGRGRDGGGA
jgi:CheY-like chemotaxis protein